MCLDEGCVGGDHGAAACDAAGSEDVIAGDHHGADVGARELLNGWAGARLDAVLKDGQPEQLQIALNDISGEALALAPRRLHASPSHCQHAQAVLCVRAQLLVKVWRQRGGVAQPSNTLWGTLDIAENGALLHPLTAFDAGVGAGGGAVCYAGAHEHGHALVSTRKCVVLQDHHSSCLTATTSTTTTTTAATAATTKHKRVAVHCGRVHVCVRRSNGRDVDVLGIAGLRQAPPCCGKQLHLQRVADELLWAQRRWGRTRRP